MNREREREREGERQRRTDGRTDMRRSTCKGYHLFSYNPQSYRGAAWSATYHGGVVWNMIYNISGSLSGDYEDVAVFWGVMRRRVVRELTQTFQTHLPPSSPIEAVDSSGVSTFITQYMVSRDRRCHLYESEFIFCFQFVRCIVDPHAVWSCYLEARFLGISYFPAAALCRVLLIMRVDRCSVGIHRKSGYSHVHCCH
jgi:hypothetical protein